MTELHWLPVTEIGSLIERREVSPVELTEAMLERIAGLNPKLHAFLAVLAERALAAAREAEAEIALGHYRSPLHGVPIAVKDLYDVEGTATTAGTTVLRDNLASRSATVVERLEGAGAVVLGKLSLTEGAMATHHPSITPPVNPWKADRWPGVSSSGSGVATAAGLCFASLGSDTGGSIRFPSAACGVVGLKPTWGRVSRAGVFPLAPSLDHVGPMTRSVADAALMLDTIAGPDPRDPTSLGAPVPDYGGAVGGNVSGLRIGVDEAFIRKDMDEEVTDLVLKALDVLTDLGAEVREISMPDTTGVVESWNPVCAAEAAVVHEEAGLYPQRAAEYGPAFRAFLDFGRSLTAMAYARGQVERLQFRGRLALLFESVDLIASPSLGVATPGLNAPPDPDETARVMRFTAPFDFSGNPTISLPCGFTGEGMPASLQLIAPQLKEELLITAAHAYEEATEWHLRRPPLA